MLPAFFEQRLFSTKIKNSTIHEIHKVKDLQDMQR